MYKQNTNRQFTNFNQSFLMAGTLIILITSLFMNACSSLVAYQIFEPNRVVMNTIISSAAAGLLIVFSNQWSNMQYDEKEI